MGWRWGERLTKAAGTGLKSENFSFASRREFMEGSFKPGKDISTSRGVQGPWTRRIF